MALWCDAEPQQEIQLLLNHWEGGQSSSTAATREQAVTHMPEASSGCGKLTEAPPLRLSEATSPSAAATACIVRTALLSACTPI